MSSDVVEVSEQDPADGGGFMRRPTRRGWMLIASGLTTLVLLAIALWLPVPYVKMSPGPTFNVIGEADGKPVIDITGTTTYPTTGRLDMTTVYESGGPRGGLTVVQALSSWLNPDDAVVPREMLFPDGVSSDQVKQGQALLFSASESNAIGAALSYLNLPLHTKVVVTGVYPDTAADGVLLPKDEILEVNGVVVTDPTQVADAVKSQPPGTSFDLKIRRDGVDVDGEMKNNVEQTVTLASRPNPEDPSKAIVGIGVGSLYSGDFPIDFTLEDVGGPSAGLMFATGIVDKLTPDDLAHGKHIAGTGTIEGDGTVGPIGGIRQKLTGARNAGAELFLMPKDHCTEAAGHVPDGLTVVPVGTLTDAVTAIKAFGAGQPLATCPVEPAPAG